MSTSIERRISRLEQANAPAIAADERDPKLVEFFRLVLGEKFREDGVPTGVSAADFIDDLLKSINGSCLKPVELPVG